ncbi:hypothetical protein LCGC14_1372410 [marine sediment metagenome]|uniref:Uncharacterized protein n=1 Tax=marine sediment metagenome TaxID=412755 RepID=A0A0F9K5B0_9ZZZZ
MASRTALEYLRLLQSLLPKGWAWNRAEGSVLTEFLYGQAEEFSRVDQRSFDLISERDTRFTSELLVDHEIDFGLPDECSEEGETIQERRAAAHSRLIALGQQNPQYFIDIAAAYGYTATVTEFSPFWCGIHGSGDPCGDQENLFYWKITITTGPGNVIYFLSGSSQSGDPLSRLVGTDSMICSLNRYKPGHTILIINFDGPEYNVEFDSAFDSLPTTTSSLEGAFSQAFGLGFDVNWGGDFEKNAFSIAYKKPF